MLHRALFFVLFAFSTAAVAADTPSRQLAAELLARTGTAAVFENPQVQAALADPEPFLGPASAQRRSRLLDEAGLRQWVPPRVWVLQSRREGDVEHWDNIAAAHEAGARLRGYQLLGAVPLRSAEEAVSLLQPGKDHPGLPTLLKAYGADVLVLVRGTEWGLWSSHGLRQGRMPTPAELFPDVLGETLAAQQQWPEAGERVVIQVSNIARLGDFAQVQAALQALPGARQVQAIRVEKQRVWFALAAPDRAALALALDAEPRLPAVAGLIPQGLSAHAPEARRLACPLLVRHWVPEAAKPPPEPAAPVQSPNS
jgi:hypothetical protein